MGIQGSADDRDRRRGRLEGGRIKWMWKYRGGGGRNRTGLLARYRLSPARPYQSQQVSQSVSQSVSDLRYRVGELERGLPTPRSRYWTIERVDEVCAPSEYPCGVGRREEEQEEGLGR
jgi:hypothetical protein